MVRLATNLAAESESLEMSMRMAVGVGNEWAYQSFIQVIGRPFISRSTRFAWVHPNTLSDLWALSKSGVSSRAKAYERTVTRNWRQTPRMKSSDDNSICAA